MELAEIYDVIRWTCERCDVPRLAERVTAQFNHRFTRCLGRAQFCTRSRTGKILLSGPLWPRASDRQRRETVVHETVHVIIDFLFADKRPRKPHGTEWRTLMLHCGLKPEVCHNVDRTGLERRTRTVEAYCDCGPHPITRHRATKIRRGYRYACIHCGGRLRLRRRSPLRRSQQTNAPQA